MSISLRESISLASRWIAPAFIALGLFGCAQPDRPRLSTVNLPAASLPAYTNGDTFVYTDGTAEPLVRRVSGVDGETVHWTTEKGFRFSTYRNFALPRLDWEGGKSSGRMMNSLAPGQLWPLQPRNKAQVTASYSRRDKATGASSAYDEFWKCKVNAARPVTVPAGTFDAFKIICRRYDATRRNVTRTHIWFYAPAVGHFVKRIKKYGRRPDQVLQLVSYQRAAG